MKGQGRISINSNSQSIINRLYESKYIEACNYQGKCIDVLNEYGIQYRTPISFDLPLSKIDVEDTIHIIYLDSKEHNKSFENLLMHRHDLKYVILCADDLFRLKFVNINFTDNNPNLVYNALTSLVTAIEQDLENMDIETVYNKYNCKNKLIDPKIMSINIKNKSLLNTNIYEL